MMATNATSFKKGQSGNPGGRPVVLGEVRAAARSRSFEAISTLAEIMNSGDESASARLRAAEILLQRAWGRPSESPGDPDPFGNRGYDWERLDSNEREMITRLLKKASRDEKHQPAARHGDSAAEQSSRNQRGGAK